MHHHGLLLPVHLHVDSFTSQSVLDVHMSSGACMYLVRVRRISVTCKVIAS